jgi:[FeFe] hydrogenase H-cluster maturation GTPase HydF
MNTAPKSLRLHIGFFGRTNVGKSSLMNYVVGQDLAITSPIPGTTTDVVEKSMELWPLGPVVLLDTAGLDDVSELGEARRRRTYAAMQRCDVVVLVCEPGQWGPPEEEVLAAARARRVPVVGVVNKSDLGPVPEFQKECLVKSTIGWITACAVDAAQREDTARRFRRLLEQALPDAVLAVPPLLGDLLPQGGWLVLIVPIDISAPRGRLILPQVQAIRDALDHDLVVTVVKESRYAETLASLPRPPDLVVCDSQVVDVMVRSTPAGIRCTTFSILMARARGDLDELARGAAALTRLRPQSRVLIAETCSHHPLEDDIGRVKLPRWLRSMVGAELHIEHVQGRDYPDDLNGYDVVIHCGSCMLTRRETLTRIERAREAGVPITNYGLAISLARGVLDRVLKPFPHAHRAFRAAVDSMVELPL